MKNKNEGRVYLAIVLDLFNREIVGWSQTKNRGNLSRWR